MNAHALVCRLIAMLVIGCAGAPEPTPARPGAAARDASPPAVVEAPDQASVDVEPPITPTKVQLPARDSSCPSPIVGPEPACGVASCGDGQRNECTVMQNRTYRTSGHELTVPQPVSVTEVCDGDDLGQGSSCEDHGFHGGELRCNAGCGLDSSGCAACAQTKQLHRCSALNVDAVNPLYFEFAVSSDRIGVVWYGAADAESAVGARFAVLDRDLQVVGRSGCFGPTDIVRRDGLGAGTQQGRISVAPTATGWLVATTSIVRAISLQAFDHEGRPIGEAREVPGYDAWLTARPGGGPLMRWRNIAGGGIHLALLQNDGSFQHPPADVTMQLEPGAHGNAVFTGDGFLLALVDQDSGLVIWRVGLDGRAIRGTTVPDTSRDETATMVWSGREARLITGSAGRLHRISRSGRVLGTAVVIDSQHQSEGYPIPAVASGRRIRLFAAPPREPNQPARASERSLITINEAGQRVGRPVPVVQDPSAQFFPFLARAMGNDVVVAWRSGGFPGAIRMAVVTGR